MQDDLTLQYFSGFAGFNGKGGYHGTGGHGGNQYKGRQYLKAPKTNTTQYNGHRYTNKSLEPNSHFFPMDKYLSEPKKMKMSTNREQRAASFYEYNQKLREGQNMTCYPNPQKHSQGMHPKF